MGLTGNTPVATENDQHMTLLETIQLILEFLTLLGLIGIAVGAPRKLLDDREFLLYASLSVTGVSAASWIVVNMLIQ
jgi:hypothetical protein